MFTFSYLLGDIRVDEERHIIFSTPVQLQILKTTYSKRGPEYRLIRSLMALPFLPSADIKPALDRLAARATSPELTRLVNYIDNTWVSSTVWQPRTWSIYQLSIRTNNDVEGMLFLFHVLSITNKLYWI